MKKVISFLSSLVVIIGSFLPSLTFANDTGFRFGVNSAQVLSQDADASWNGINQTQSSNNSYATVTLSNEGDTSHYLRPTNFGFIIPADATIEGIEVTIEKSEGNLGTASIKDNLVKLSKNHQPVGDNKAHGAVWSTTDQVTTYGGPNDLWGTTRTAAEVNNTKFGIFVSAARTAGTAEQAKIDHIAIKVYYTPTVPPVANPVLSQSCGLDIAYVIDRSGSIDADEMNNLRQGLIGLTNAFVGTPTVFSLTTFETTATVINNFSMNPAEAVAALGTLVGNGHGDTNWEDGLAKGFGTLDPRPSKPNLIIFASDGDPTDPGTDAEALAAAVVQANKIKSSGTRILTVGINLTPDGIEKMKMISGPNVDFGSAETDVVTTTWGEIPGDLARIAQELCGGTITVSTYLENFDTPAGAGIPYLVADIHELTDDQGQTNPVDVTDGIYAITQLEAPDGYKFEKAVCYDQNGTVVGDDAPQGRENIMVDGDDIIHCDVINKKIEIIPDAYCGNGIVEVGESCDDGNHLDGDGCSRICTIEVEEDNDEDVLTPVDVDPDGGDTLTDGEDEDPDLTDIPETPDNEIPVLDETVDQEWEVIPEVETEDEVVDEPVTPVEPEIEDDTGRGRSYQEEEGVVSSISPETIAPVKSSNETELLDTGSEGEFTIALTNSRSLVPFVFKAPQRSFISL